MAWHEASVPLPSVRRSRLRSRSTSARSLDQEITKSPDGTPSPHRNHAVVSCFIFVPAFRDASARLRSAECVWRDDGGASPCCDIAWIGGGPKPHAPSPKSSGRSAAEQREPRGARDDRWRCCRP